MATNPNTDLSGLQALLRQKQDELATASLNNTPQTELVSLYKGIKEIQYQIVLLRNNVLDPVQAELRASTL
jgi:hypothetical protein